MRTNRKDEETELVNVRTSGVGSIEVESILEDMREVRLDQPSKVRKPILTPSLSTINRCSPSSSEL